MWRKTFYFLVLAFLSIALLSCGSGDEPKAVDEPGAEEGAVGDDSEAPEAVDEEGAEGGISSLESAAGVCGRSPAMREAILNEVNSGWLPGFLRGTAKTCAEVTAEDLFNIKSLNLSDKGLTEFKPQELSGMTRLRWLKLGNNELTSFSTDWLDDFPSIKHVSLKGNNFSDEDKSRLIKWGNNRRGFQFGL